MLTAAQSAVLEAAVEFISTHGRAPTMRELCVLTNRKLATIHEHVTSLEGLGLIQRDGRTWLVIHPRELAVPEPDGTIPPGAKYVPVSALPALFQTWQQKRQVEGGC